MLDPDTMAALSIFVCERHPSNFVGVAKARAYLLQPPRHSTAIRLFAARLFKLPRNRMIEDGGGRAHSSYGGTHHGGGSHRCCCCPQEGLSVFSVMDKTFTPGGRRLLRTWFSRPICEPASIARRHEAVAFLLARPHQQPWVESGASACCGGGCGGPCCWSAPPRLLLTAAAAQAGRPSSASGRRSFASTKAMLALLVGRRTMRWRARWRSTLSS